MENLGATLHQADYTLRLGTACLGVTGETEVLAKV